MMRRAEIVEYNKPLVIRELPIPKPPPQGLVVKTCYAGVCHSDVHLWEDCWDMGGGKIMRVRDVLGNARLPLVMGHEIGGIVHSIGSESDDEADQTIRIGDRVVLYPWMGCGSCGLCRGPDPYQCPSVANNLGVVAPGGFSTHVAILRRKHVFKIPDAIPMDVACTLPCSALTAYNAVSTTKEVLEKRHNQNNKPTLMIVGAGGLGLWSLQIAKAILPSTVTTISVDISEEKLQIALQCGADKTVCWRTDMTDKEAKNLVLKASGTRTIDGVVDFVGSGTTVQRGLSVVSKGGIVVPVGLFGGKLDAPLYGLITKSVTLASRCVGSLSQLADVIKLAHEAKITSPPLIHFSLDEVNDALVKLRNGEIKGRGIIKH